MNREEFKNAVFERDQNRCVICGEPAIDAHHILDRKLWPDGGYYRDNGVSLCAPHHLDAERTLLSCAILREKAGITKLVLPEHFFQDEEYDHWGNIVRPNGTRIKGDLYHRPEVQKILQESGITFSPYVKYPRTYHLPWSPGLGKSDRQHRNVDFFDGLEVVVSEKMDGECTSLYRDYFHARSIDSSNHPSRAFVKRLHGGMAYEIPEGWRVCGENLYAKHSIQYEHLKEYFQVYSIWDSNNTCLDWDQTREYSELLGLKAVPVFYRGVWDRQKIEEAFEAYKRIMKDEVEGYVIRTARSFGYGAYRLNTAKWVRHNHVQTDEFWMTSRLVLNKVSEHGRS